ncbi:hypothetical protein [Metabacillus endolithicus]|uniref:1,4-dihydroxy-2-naphthoate octaprenyltransferase n=1 Tax=Metabacillus endolithicus TaxID=1535204 RepID=A0ABW5BY52_9BACI|nr:hypothetical protein [Metabacillus endolithicus]UPG64739.1 hypothetical protein MVE64_06695 [Metabacillus endolithicus]
MGFIFTLLGAYTAYRYWGDNTVLVVIAIIATLYQASSLREMAMGDDRVQVLINFLAAMVILGLFIFSFF